VRAAREAIKWCVLDEGESYEVEKLISDLPFFCKD
jgi:hypothetical protein